MIWNDYWLKIVNFDNGWLLPAGFTNYYVYAIIILSVNLSLIQRDPRLLTVIYYLLVFDTTNQLWKIFSCCNFVAIWYYTVKNKGTLFDIKNDFFF